MTLNRTRVKKFPHGPLCYNVNETMESHDLSVATKMRLLRDSTCDCEENIRDEDK